VALATLILFFQQPEDTVGRKKPCHPTRENISQMRAEDGRLQILSSTEFYVTAGVWFPENHAPSSDLGEVQCF